MTDPFAQPALPSAGDDGAYTFDGKPDRWKRYRLPDPRTGKPGGFTRATTFAKSISDTFTLSQWSQRMVAKGVSMRPDLLAAVASTPLADREKLNKLAESAKETAGAKEGANLGTAVHAFTERIDRGELKAEDVPAPWDRDCRAYAALLEQEGIEIVPEFIERITFCDRFDPAGIAGTFDRIVRLTRPIDVRLPGGEIRTLQPGLYIFDLKTGRDLEYGWLEIAVQLGLYANASHVFDKGAKSWDEMPEVDQVTALVLHLPVGKGVATLHGIDIKAGAQFADLCTMVRNARKTKGIAYPIATIDLSASAEGPIRVDSERVHDPSWEDRASSARTVADLSALRIEAMTAKTWTPTVERLALERRDAILADTAGG